MVWVIGQAFVNIAVVLQLLPVLGVPLPLMSSGGSALITTLVALGVVLGIAKRPPAGDDAALPPTGVTAAAPAPAPRSTRVPAAAPRSRHQRGPRQ
jgi:cell division protein FtsW